MAPALVDPLPIRETPEKPKLIEGFNKEAFISVSTAYDNDAELNGTASQPPATYPNYLPVWDNEKGVKYVLFSFLFFFPE
jgi:sulfonate dioxygenase